MNRSSRFIAIVPVLIFSACRDGPTSLTKVTVASPPASGSQLSTTKLEDATWSEPVRLSGAVNTSFNEQGPTLSPDALSLYFCSNNPLGGQGGNDLWVAHRTDEQSDWGPSADLGPVVNSPNGDCGPNLSADGHLLFFTSNRPGGSGNNDLYVSRRDDPNDDFGWESPIVVGAGVNTPMFEFSPFFLESAETGAINLYFERGPSNVATDIFAAAISRTGEVMSPAEAVSELNSLATDGHPTMRADGREVFIHSNRDGVNFDIYVSTRKTPNESWSVPAKVEELSTAGSHEIHPSISRDGRTIVFTRGLGTANDIWLSVRDRHTR